MSAREKPSGTGPGSDLSFRAPLYVAWELTHLCNAECIHCYSASSPWATRADELATDESLHLVDDLAEAGVLILAFSGGEPLLRHDWPRLVDRAVRRGLGVNIGTNGVLVSEAMAKQIAASGVHSVTVSIDSHDAATHDAFRRRDGLHARALRAVDWLTREGVRVVVGFTPTRLNSHHGTEVVRLAYEHGAAAVNLSEYVPAGRGALDLALSPTALHGVLSEWIELRQRYRGRMEVHWHDCQVGMLVTDEEKRDYVGCGAGRLVARICPDGAVTPCVFLSTAIGNVRRTRFMQLWQNSELLAQLRRRDGNVGGDCRTCAHLNSCGGCRAVAHAYSKGDLFAGDPHCWLEEHEREPLTALGEGEGLPC